MPTVGFFKNYFHLLIFSLYTLTNPAKGTIKSHFYFQAQVLLVTTGTKMSLYSSLCSSSSGSWGSNTLQQCSEHICQKRSTCHSTKVVLRKPMSARNLRDTHLMWYSTKDVLVGDHQGSYKPERQEWRTGWQITSKSVLRAGPVHICTCAGFPYVIGLMNIAFQWACDMTLRLDIQGSEGVILHKRLHYLSG